MNTLSAVPGALRSSLAVVALALTACGQATSKPEDKAKEEVAIPVEAEAIGTGTVIAAYRGTATLEAEDEATVVARTPGVIEQILVEEGDRVSRGQVLARLDTDRLRLELARAKASRDNLEAVHKRNESVFQRNLVSREAYERSQFELDAARAAYDLALLSLQESEIRAPFAGMVTARHIKVGNMIQPGTEAFRVTQLDRLQAHLYVPERDLHKLKPGHPVRLQVDAWPERVFTGQVVRVNPVVDAATGTVKVTAEMTPGQAELKPGMFGRVEITYDRFDGVLRVPAAAVLTEDTRHTVFVVSEGRARRRPLTLGVQDDGYYQVLDGLSDGEQIVTTGQSSLRDDARVEIVGQPPAPAAAEATSPAAG